MLNELLTLLANSIMLPERWHHIFILGCNILIAVFVVALCFMLVRAWLRPILARILDKLDGRLTHETERERRSLASHLAHLLPALVLQALLPVLFSQNEHFSAVLGVLV